MIYSLRGNLVFRDGIGVAIDCSGVAYYCRTTISTLSKLGKLGEEVTLYTYLQLRTDALDLFGFYDQSELSCFKMLTSVTGVGAKAALSILSSMSPEAFAFCVASGDYKAITAAPGVGQKLSQRIVLELKDKVAASDATKDFFSSDNNILSSASGNFGEALSALVVLGYSRGQASAAIEKLDQSLSVQDIIKSALKIMARQ